ncbi:hypothetical protein HGP13_34475 [Mesorhizobium sp. NZP2077]|uniref:hypothetical protein n=1 Tax=Mesorhizobium sp. NZP2077 TaxID=2483404 RepID=UPI00155357DF|nr:hypothetical protein [Mesorhizobium sp. NZP2077]QKD19631.1 hypothetical protein HGP13_34475 [Mesorhizobium sp. NZP2077]
MNAIQINGKVIAEALRTRVARDVALVQTECNATSVLACRVSRRGPGQLGLCEEESQTSAAVGFKSQQFLLPSDVEEARLLRLIDEPNTDGSIWPAAGFRGHRDKGV